MANIKSAKKRIRVIEKKTLRNRRVKAHLKEIVKGFDASVAEGKEQEARDFLALAEKKLLQAGAKGTIHKKAASRKVSRLTARFVKEFGPDALKLKANPPAIPTAGEKAARRAEKEAEKAAAHAKKRGRRKDALASVEAEEAPADEAAETAEAEDTPADETTEAEEAAADETAEAEEAPADEAAETETTETDKATD
jgi:small subunit ribosomal protein S20